MFFVEDFKFLSKFDAKLNPLKIFNQLKLPIVIRNTCHPVLGENVD
jgi:hypothetical protein